MAEAPGAGALRIRDAEQTDLAAVQRIYAHHVREGLASFEEVSPDQAEIARRFTAVRAAGLPYLVAELDGRVIGFAYAGPFRDRPAYRYTIENSVYVVPAAVRRGAGGALLGNLIERCREGGYRQMIAVIGDRDNASSISLHERLGFRRIGRLEAVGFKHGRWVDVVLMQRALSPDDSPP
jgi:phosphinothricin acetyltransferase